MIRIHAIITSLLILISLVSCEKEELPVTAHNAGNVITASAELNADYKFQLFYDLKTNSIVGKNLKTIWDLGFETGIDGFNVILNSAKAMYAYNTNNTDFQSVTDTTGLKLNAKPDNPTGDLALTAIGDWRINKPVYIIDRGYDEAGKHQGYRKIQMLSQSSTNYIVKYALLNGTNENTVTISKNDDYNFTFLSFTTGQETLVEPPKATWDLAFTQYTHVFYDPYQPYLVTGCLLNRYQTTANMDSTSVFSTIDFTQANSLTLAPAINTIGYNWKTFNGSNYTTNTKINYVIKDSEGLLYKLHFIDFYSKLGIKGCPTWEYQQL